MLIPGGTAGRVGGSHATGYWTPGRAKKTVGTDGPAGLSQPYSHVVVLADFDGLRRFNPGHVSTGHSFATAFEGISASAECRTLKTCW